MEDTYDFYLPDGTHLEAPVSMSEGDALAYARKTFPEIYGVTETEAPEDEETTFLERWPFGPYKAGVGQSLYYQMAAGWFAKSAAAPEGSDEAIEYLDKALEWTKGATAVAADLAPNTTTWEDVTKMEI